MPLALRLLVLVAALLLWAAPSAAQTGVARPGDGYVARALDGGAPVGAVRGRYPGTTTPVLFVVNHPTQDSTVFSAFEGGRLVKRLSVPIPSADVHFLDATIPSPADENVRQARVYAVFTFDASEVVVSVLWNHNLDTWAVVTRSKANSASRTFGNTDWFGREALDAQSPMGGPDGGLPRRAWKRDSRQISMTGTTSLRIERTAYREVPDVHHRIGVYDGEVGPVQTMNGITFTSPSAIDAYDPQACSGLPVARDVNGDGFQDFWLCESEAANGYQSGTYRLYDSEAGLFVKDLAFAFSGSHSFDEAARTIREAQWSMAGQYQTHREYDLASGVPVLVRERTREPENDECAGGPTCRSRFTTRERDSDTMRETESRLGRPDESLPGGFGMEPGAPD